MFRLSIFRQFALLAAVLFLAVSFDTGVAEARRFGGGLSFGKQSSNVTQRQAAPRESAAASRTQQSPATAPRSRMGGIFAGLAAGLGLAWLASALGLGEEFATLLLFGLIAMVVFGLVRAMQARTMQGRRPAMAGAQTGWNGAQTGWDGAPQRPTNQHGARFEAAGQAGGHDPSPQHVQGAGAIGGAAAASWRIPAEMDVDAFLANARKQFVSLQRAYDAGDLDALREFTSVDVFDELERQVRERGGADNHTEVVTLDAELLGVESDASEHMASVRFTGLLREQADGEAAPIDEVWNLVKPVDGSAGWTLAGIQQLG